MTPERALGNIERGDGRATLRFTRNLTHPPEKVWRALTESEHMRWWMPVDMIGDRAAGATVRMVFWPDIVEAKGLEPDARTATIEVWEPQRTFEFLWHGSRIRFDITPTSTGSELSLTVNIDSDDPDVLVDNAGGYHLWMDHLETLMDTGSSPPIADADSTILNDQYRALVEQQ